MYPQLSPCIFYLPERPYGNFHVRITLPQDYYEIAPKLDKARIDEMMKRHSRNLAAFSAVYENVRKTRKPRKLEPAHIMSCWDEKRGLYLVEIQEPPFAPSLFLEEGEFEYQTHNISTVPHVLSLAMIGLDYLNYVNCLSALQSKK